MKKQKSVNKLRIIGIVFAFAMIFSIGSEVVKTFQTKMQISEVQVENSKLKEESQKLKNEVAKLNDKKYLQTYASGSLFITEKGTKVYFLPKDEKAPE